MMQEKITLLEKQFSHEELHDIGETIEDSISYGPGKEIPVDEHGFFKGSFSVHVEWIFEE